MSWHAEHERQSGETDAFQGQMPFKSLRSPAGWFWVRRSRPRSARRTRNLHEQGGALRMWLAHFGRAKRPAASGLPEATAFDLCELMRVGSANDARGGRSGQIHRSINFASPSSPGISAARTASLRHEPLNRYSLHGASRTLAWAPRQAHTTDNTSLGESRRVS
jgi:hypothetical protein